MKKLLGLGVLVAAAVTVDVNAGCPSPVLFGTFDTDSGTYTYVNFAPGGNNASIVGRFWQSGNRALSNEGTYDDASWLKQYAANGNWYISGDLSDGGIVGCPGTAMSLLLQDTRNGQFSLARVAEDPTGAAALKFNFASAGNMTLVDAPFVRLTNRSVATPNVSYTVVVSPVTGGFYSDGSSTAAANITGYQVVQRRRSSSSQPDFNAAGWANVGAAVPAGGGSVPVTVDCTVQDQVDLGVRILFDGGAFSSDVISGRAQLSCDPNLADPDRKFKVIDRKAGKEPLTPRQ